MKIKLFSVLLAASVLVFTQCKKDDGGSDTPTAIKDYAPLTAGSTFSFRNIVSTSTVTDTANYTLTVGGADTVYNGRTYKRLTGSDTSVRFMAKVGTNYYQLATFAALNTGVFENYYLNDSVPVNTTWPQTISFTYNIAGAPTNLTATLNYKIAERGMSRTVNSIAYSNVIRVSFSGIAVTGAPIPVNITATGDSYYAQGFGLIESTLSVPQQNIVVFGTPVGTIPQYNSKEILLSSNVK